LYVNEERPTGFLRTKDRKYLEDREGYLEEYTRQAAYNRKREIKKRLAHALIDMAMLSDAVDDERRDELLEGAADELEKFGQVKQSLDGGPPFILPRAVSVLYGFVEETRGDDFEDTLRLAVQLFQNPDIGPREVVVNPAEVKIGEADTIDLDEVEKKMERGETHKMSEEELRYAVNISNDEFRDRMKNLIDEHDVPAREAYESARSHFRAKNKQPENGE
jgi:hypothetical protein